MFSVAELETNVEGEEDWWVECCSYNSTWRAKRHIFWSWALYRAGISVVRVTYSARRFVSMQSGAPYSYRLGRSMVI